jgi:FkbM family methyltransferase
MHTARTMSLIQKLKELVEELTSTRNQSLPRGVDSIQDIATYLPMLPVDMIFDVGANVGQSAALYAKRFPKSRIYCFEPASDTFHQLRDMLKGSNLVACYQLAFGASSRKEKMVLQGSSNMFFLLDTSKSSQIDDDVKTEWVDVVTLDEFCQTNEVERINYLKIDTEGGDLDVLKGSVMMLSEQRIDLVEVEAGMNPKNDRHVPFEALKAFLESHQYFLFGIYEQFHEWPTREPHLRRTNPIFISQKTIEANSPCTMTI